MSVGNGGFTQSGDSSFSDLVQFPSHTMDLKGNTPNTKCVRNPAWTPKSALEMKRNIIC